jgi:hypothetical protein
MGADPLPPEGEIRNGGSTGTEGGRSGQESGGADGILKATTGTAGGEGKAADREGGGGQG